MVEGEWLRLRDAAGRFGVTAEYLRQLAATGRVPARRVRVGNRALWELDAAATAAFMAGAVAERDLGDLGDQGSAAEPPVDAASRPIAGAPGGAISRPGPATPTQTLNSDPEVEGEGGCAGCAAKDRQLDALWAAVQELAAAAAASRRPVA